MGGPGDGVFRWRRWQRRVFATCWLTYASLYLGRVNIAVALPALQAVFGWTKPQAGLIGAAFFWVYAVGQLINGALGDRWPARILVALGLLASAAANAAFGWAGSVAAMALLWGLNGYAQSMGWGPIMRVLSHWFDAQERGRIAALFGPCYAVGHVASWLLASWLVTRSGWRVAFWVPAGVLALSAFHWWTRIRPRPQDAGLEAPQATNASGTPASLGGVFAYVRARRPLQWATAACLLLGVVKESLTLWIPTYVVETQGFDVARAAWHAIWLPLAGAVGIALSGWLSQRFFRAEEAPVVAGLMGALALTLALFRPLLAALGTASIPLFLALVGAMTYGANGLLLTALPLTHGAQGRVSSVAGFLDFALYIGSGLGGVSTGILVDGWGWGAAFGFWSAVAVGGMATMLALWRRADA